MDKTFYDIDQRHLSESLAEFLKLFCCHNGATFLFCLQYDMVALRKIHIIKSYKLQKTFYLILDQLSSRRQQQGNGLSDILMLNKSVIQLVYDTVIEWYENRSGVVHFHRLC